MDGIILSVRYYLLLSLINSKTRTLFAYQVCVCTTQKFGVLLVQIRKYWCFPGENYKYPQYLLVLQDLERRHILWYKMRNLDVMRRFKEISVRNVLERCFRPRDHPEILWLKIVKADLSNINILLDNTNPTSVLQLENLDTVQLESI